MDDDSPIKKQSKLRRAQTTLSDSFRMATSVLQQGGSGPSKKALNLVIPNIRIYQKDDYKKQPECQVCFMQFGRFGQHHCRICANAICSSCSYSTINKQRACDICAYHHSDKQRQKFKKQTIEKLTDICVNYLSNKHKAEEQIKKLQSQALSQQQIINQKAAIDSRCKKLQQKLQLMANKKKEMQRQIEMLKQS